MPKYLKYNLTDEYFVSSFQFVHEFTNSALGSAKNYTLNIHTGTITFIGEQYGLSEQNRVGYSKRDNTILQKIIYKDSHTLRLEEAVIQRRKGKGTFGGVVVTAPEGTYPDYGEKDGYFYEKTDWELVVGIRSGTYYNSHSSDPAGEVLDPATYEYKVEAEGVIYNASSSKIRAGFQTFLKGNNGETRTQVRYGENGRPEDSHAETYMFDFLPSKTKAIQRRSARISVRAGDNRGVINLDRSYRDGEVNVYLFRKLKNTNPTISGSDSDLGAKNDAFDITYQVSDVNADSLTVTETLNGSILRSISNAPRTAQTIVLSREQVFSLPINQSNTIEIKVDDNNGGIAYRRYTFTRTNAAPIISPAEVDLGSRNETFSIRFSATDHEEDSMVARIYLNDRLIKEYSNIISGEENIYLIPRLEFMQLRNNDTHKLRIEVIDKNGATAVRHHIFTRPVSQLQYKFVKQTDQMAKQIIISPTWYVAPGATAKVEVCNNGLDESPTWENATDTVMEDRQYHFINQTKTATHFAVGIRITIDKGSATKISYLAGFGGGYK